MKTAISFHLVYSDLSTNTKETTDQETTHVSREYIKWKWVPDDLQEGEFRYFDLYHRNVSILCQKPYMKKDRLVLKNEH